MDKKQWKITYTDRAGTQKSVTTSRITGPDLENAAKALMHYLPALDSLPDQNQTDKSQLTLKNLAHNGYSIVRVEEIPGGEPTGLCCLYCN